MAPRQPKPGPKYSIILACRLRIAELAIERRLRKKGSGALMERGVHKPGDAENRLGFYEGQLGR
jgi:hypothetical protein